MNTLAVIALILGLCGGGPIAMVLAIIALRQIKRRGGPPRGDRGMAVLALVVSALWTVLGLITAFFVIVGFDAFLG